MPRPSLEITTVLAVLGALCATPLEGQTDPRIEQAVLPLPEESRADATVLAVEGGTTAELRGGTGSFICLADDPNDDRFQVSCYHESLEPYMARGRELANQGVGRRESISQRWEEIDAGSLEMPEGPATLISLFGEDPAAVDPADTAGLNRLTVIYMAYATAEDAGLSANPGAGPWMMFSGKPTAHIMISG